MKHIPVWKTGKIIEVRLFPDHFLGQSFLRHIINEGGYSDHFSVLGHQWRVVPFTQDGTTVFRYIFIATAFTPFFRQQLLPYGIDGIA